jgi:hypothetical protein
VIKFLALVVSWTCLFALPAGATEQPASLDAGFRLLYGLDFAGAEREFVQWLREHPRDPLGPLSQAANVLFAELDRAGILQAQFFANDASFASRRTLAMAPDGGQRARFELALADSDRLAKRRLAINPEDRDALFASALADGLRADCAALIDGRQFAALRDTREAAGWARKLLAVDPGYADGYLATGMSEYIVGSLTAPTRLLLRIAGYGGDKRAGLREIRVTAERGRLLGPFARILLALAAVRDGDTVGARALLEGLAREFPSNPLFASERRRLDAATK